MTPDASDQLVFAVRRGNIANRLDVNYNAPKYTSLIAKLRARFGNELAAIGEVADVICGPFGSAIKNSDYREAGIPLIRIANISKTGYMDYSDLVYISEELGASLSRTQVATGDIVISQRGSLGQCAIIDDRFEKLNISANIIAIKNIKGLSAEFIHDYLLSTVGQTLLERSVSGQVQQKITTQDVAGIPIPLHCDEDSLSQIMNTAYGFCVQKEKEIDNIQRRVSSAVLSMAGLYFDVSKKGIYYATRFSSIEGRIDADYYSPQFVKLRDQIYNSLYPSVEIGEISTKIISGFAAGKQSQADDLSDDMRVPHLRPFSITSNGELSFETKKYVPKEQLKEDDYCKIGEVLFNNTNSSVLVGKTTVFDVMIPCAVSNHITRISVIADVNPYYIAALFNALRQIGYWELLSTSFNNQASINSETLKRVRIPLPPKDIQDQIGTEILSSRKKVRTLEQKRTLVWENAKEQFEHTLFER